MGSLLQFILAMLMSGLMYLNEATLLNNVRLRYERDQIYTYVANILIAVNPYFSITGLYESETIQKYQGKSLGTLAPHVFAIADKAYRDLKRFKESQSIIVSGESGAGKTENQKFILRYLCECWGTHAGPVEQRILETNPILEAFGNAKTLRNNNSSRFGKFVEIHFDQKLLVSGGYVSHYLLEKSRICHQQRDERNYHIFYQLSAGAPKQLFDQLQLKPPDQFNYLKHGCCQYFCSGKNAGKLGADRLGRSQQQRGALSDPVIDDINDFNHLDSSLKGIGLSDEDRFQVYAIVASLLHLGNIEFGEDPEDTRGGCGVLADSQGSLLMASGLLGLDRDELRIGLTTRVMQTAKGGAQGTIIRVPLKTGEACHARDALAKAVYSHLFDFIVKRINQCIPFTHSNGYIGVLDIAGFEYFTVNSFEQFCINYCNEKLQHFFNDRILKQEQELYEKEGLNVKKIEFVDNEDCIELIEYRGQGILDVLDEENKLPRPTAQHFTTAIHQLHKNHFRLAVPRKSKLREHRDLRDDEGFLIRHFAGAVCYHTALFIDKNNDALHASLEFLLSDSKSSLVRTLFKPTVDENGPSANGYGDFYAAAPKSKKAQGKLGFVSVGSKFRAQLLKLLEKLDGTGTNFVRCIKPNSKMVSHNFEGGQILSQLQCSGMTSVLQLMQQGFPSRTQFIELYRMYTKYMPSDLARLDPRLFCKCLFKALGLDENDYKFGLTKVFFRPGKFAEFDQMLRSDPENLAQLIKRVRQWLMRVRWKKAQWCALSVIKLKNKIKWRRECLVKIQSSVRKYLAQKKYRHRYKGIMKVKTLHVQLSSLGELVKKLHKDQNVWAQRVRMVENDMSALIQTIKMTPMTAVQIDREYAQLMNTMNSTFQELRSQADLQKAAEQARLKKVQEEMAKEKMKRDIEEKEKREQEEAKKRKQEIEARRKKEELESQAKKSRLQMNGTVNVDIAPSRQAETETQRKSAEEGERRELARIEQERRDHDLALRLAAESNGVVDDLVVQRPAHSSSVKKHDLSKWKYAEIRDIINTTTDIELLEACRDEFHRRLQLYQQWKEKNRKTSMPNPTSQSNGMTRSDSSNFQRLPFDMQSISLSQFDPFAATVSNGATGKVPTSSSNPQRFFRVPFARPADAHRDGHGGAVAQVKRGYWYAHFDGQWIARQMEVHPEKVPLLLVAGRDDMQMCELSLEQTGLTLKRGAEVLANDFEIEWRKFNGPPYIASRNKRNVNNVTTNVRM